MDRAHEHTPPSRVRRYPSLDGLRALSVALVVIHHLALKNHIFEGLDLPRGVRSLAWFLQDGHLGVNVFFVISGFLITSLLLREERRTETISLKGFYARRTLRIFPAYFFLLGVYCLLQLAGIIQISAASWLTALTYTKYFNWQLDWYTGHFWSLSIEEHFYVLWPLIFLAGPRTRKWVACALLVLVPLIRTWVHFHPISWIDEFTIFMRIDSIALGCLFAIYQDQIAAKLTPHWRKVFVLSVGGLFFLRCYAHLLQRVRLDFLYIPLGTSHGSIANLFIAVIMMFSVFGPRGVWFRFLNLRFLSYLGVLSYSIYLWQQIFISGLPYWINQFPQNLAGLLLAALGSYYLIEQPFLRLKGRFSSAGSS